MAEVKVFGGGDDKKGGAKGWFRKLPPITQAAVVVGVPAAILFGVLRRQSPSPASVPQMHAPGELADAFNLLETQIASLQEQLRPEFDHSPTTSPPGSMPFDAIGRLITRDPSVLPPGILKRLMQRTQRDESTEAA